eukprot:m.155098 g.155098  ORF g.155098 m.155098 type:complete len:939 (+) comp16406_c0_seq1:102-2918(+)
MEDPDLLGDFDLELTEADLVCRECTALQQSNATLKAEVKALEAKSVTTSKVVALCQKLKQDVKDKAAELETSKKLQRHLGEQAKANGKQLADYQKQLNALKLTATQAENTKEELIKLRKQVNELNRQVRVARAADVAKERDQAKAELSKVTSQHEDTQTRLTLAQERIKAMMVEQHAAKVKQEASQREITDLLYKVDQLEHTLKSEQAKAADVGTQTLVELSTAPSPSNKEATPTTSTISTNSDTAMLYDTITRLENELKDAAAAKMAVETRLGALQARLTKGTATQQTEVSATPTTLALSVTTELELTTSKKTIKRLEAQVQTQHTQLTESRNKVDAGQAQIDQLETRVKKLQQLLDQAGVDAFTMVTGKFKTTKRTKTATSSPAADSYHRSSPGHPVPEADALSVASTHSSSSSPMEPRVPDVEHMPDPPEPMSRRPSRDADIDSPSPGPQPTNTTTASTSAAAKRRPARTKTASHKLAKLCNSADAQRFLNPAAIQRPSPELDVMTSVSSSGSSLPRPSARPRTAEPSKRTSRTLKEHATGRSPPKQSRLAPPRPTSTPRPTVLTTAVRKVPTTALSAVDWASLVKTQIGNLLNQRKSPEQIARTLQPQPLTSAMLDVVVVRVLEVQSACSSKVLRVLDAREAKLARLLALLSTDDDLRQGVEQHLLDVAVAGKHASTWNSAPCRCLRLLASKHLRSPSLQPRLQTTLVDLLRLHWGDPHASATLSLSVLHTWPEVLTGCLPTNTTDTFLQSLGYHVTTCLKHPVACEGLLAQVHEQTARQWPISPLNIEGVTDTWIRQMQQGVAQDNVALMEEASLGLELIVGVQAFNWCYEHVLHDDFWVLMDTVFALPNPSYLTRMVSLATRCIRRGLTNNVTPDEDAAITFLLGSLLAMQKERTVDVQPVLRKTLGLSLIKSPKAGEPVPEWHAALRLLCS